MQRFRFNRHIAKKCRRAYGNPKNDDKHHYRHGHGHRKHAGNIFADIVSGIAEGLFSNSPEAATDNSNASDTQNAAREQTHSNAANNSEKAEDEARVYAETAEKYARASRDILTQFAQNFHVMLDPFGANVDIDMTNESGPNPAEKPKGKNSTENEKEKTPSGSGASSMTQQKSTENTPMDQDSSSSSHLDKSVNCSAPVLPAKSVAESNPMETNREKSPVLSKEWTVVDADGLVEEPTAPVEGNSSKSSTPSTSSSSSAKQPMDYKKLASVLESHIKAAGNQSQEKLPAQITQNTQTPEPPTQMPPPQFYHPSNYFFCLI